MGTTLVVGVISDQQALAAAIQSTVNANGGDLSVGVNGNGELTFSNASTTAVTFGGTDAEQFGLSTVNGYGLQPTATYSSPGIVAAIARNPETTAGVGMYATTASGATWNLRFWADCDYATSSMAMWGGLYPPPGRRRRVHPREGEFPNRKRASEACAAKRQWQRGVSSRRRALVQQSGQRYDPCRWRNCGI